MTYAFFYVFMTLGAFGVVMGTAADLLWVASEARTLDGYQGLAAQRPGTAALMLLFLLSLTGIPPTAGFAAKFDPTPTPQPRTKPAPQRRPSRRRTTPGGDLCCGKHDLRVEIRMESVENLHEVRRPPFPPPLESAVPQPRRGPYRAGGPSRGCCSCSVRMRVGVWTYRMGVGAWP